MRNLSPCWTVLSSGIPLVRRHWRGKAIQVLHDDVAPPLPGPMPGSSCWELAEHHTLGQANVLHARNVTQPAKTMLTDDVADVTINLEGLCQCCRGDTVIPLLPSGDANDDPHALVMEDIQTTQVWCHRSPCFCSIKQSRQDKRDINPTPTPER